jgi:branched-chain amino acid aminotransferase
MENLVFINDQFVPEEKACLHYRDLAIQRGYGVFDFLKVQNRSAVYLNDHLDRFYQSANKLRLSLPERKRIEEIIQEIISQHTDVNYGIRLTLTGGQSNDGYTISNPNLIISTHNFPSVTIDQFKAGIKLVSYPYQRQLPEVKTIDYIMAIYLQPFVREKDADDVLYHNNDSITECPRSNIFIISRNETIVTPAKNILKGITRKNVIEKIKTHFTIEERDINLEEIYTANAAFITSTTKSVLPVRQINDYKFRGAPEIIERLSAIISVENHT